MCLFISHGNIAFHVNSHLHTVHIVKVQCIGVTQIAILVLSGRSSQHRFFGCWEDVPCKTSIAIWIVPVVRVTQMCGRQRSNFLPNKFLVFPNLFRVWHFLGLYIFQSFSQNFILSSGLLPIREKMSKMASVNEAELVKLSKQLQGRLGISPRVYIERFQNWGRNQKALVLSVKPKSLSDIQVSE